MHKFGGPEVLQLDDVADPTAGPGQVLVQIKAAGVNPVDTYIRSGTYAQRPALPYIPGGDARRRRRRPSATGVTRFKPGDRVWVAARAAGYAELAACDAAHGAAAAGGALVRAGRGGRRAVRHRLSRAAPQGAGRGRARRVLVHGASGGVGIAAVQLARRARHDGHRHRRHRARAASSSPSRAPITCSTTRRRTTRSGCMELTEGRGADVILEMLANVNLEKDLDVRRALRPHRRSSATAAPSRSTRAARWPRTRRSSAWRCGTRRAAELASIHRRPRRRPGQRHAAAGRGTRASARRRRRRPQGRAGARRLRQDRPGPVAGRGARSPRGAGCPSYYVGMA